MLAVIYWQRQKQIHVGTSIYIAYNSCILYI